MAGGLDTLLSYAVPIGVFILFGVILWRAFGNEISGFANWVRENMSSKSAEPPVQQNQYSGKKNPYGWESGGIAYGN
jgi:hypothetical protein